MVVSSDGKHGGLKLVVFEDGIGIWGYDKPITGCRSRVGRD